MNRYRSWSVILIIVMLILGWFIYASQKGGTGFVSKFPFKLGLDLAGGTDVIERRVNLFGVSEPIVQIEGAGTFSNDNKLIVDLPGVTDINQAIALIGQTPLLEFRLIDPSSALATTTDSAAASSTEQKTPYQLSKQTGLTGGLLSNATLLFNNQTGAQPVVSLKFNDEGSDLFAKITRENTGKILGIFLDREPISLPVIQEEITGGEATISGGFTAPEARDLVKNLNYGALPVPIQLIGTQTIGPSLGSNALFAGIKSGLWGIALVALFLVLWYRLPGLIATVALIMYVILSLVIFKLIPVTLTAAGIAGFILSIGMAVDANILIFERTKEELKRGKSLHDALHEGFHRAWLSIRDSNISSMITALVLFWLGTSAVKGFALTFGLGVLISMFTAITVSRTFLFAVAPKLSTEGRLTKFLFGAGIK
jgi:preprotein translocase subunit SecD